MTVSHDGRQLPMPPSYADLLNDHCEVIQGQSYTQEHGNQPDWHERQNPAKPAPGGRPS